MFLLLEEKPHPGEETYVAAPLIGRTFELRVAGKEAGCGKFATGGERRLLLRNILLTKLIIDCVPFFQPSFHEQNAC